MTTTTTTTTKHTHTQTQTHAHAHAYATTTTTTSRLACKIARQRGPHILLAESRTTSIFTSCLRILQATSDRASCLQRCTCSAQLVSPRVLSPPFLGRFPPAVLYGTPRAPPVFACYNPSVVALALYCAVLAQKTCTAQLVPN